MNKEKVIKITIVVVIVLSICGIFIFKSIEKSNIEKMESDKKSIINIETKKDVNVNIYNENNLPTLLDFSSTTCEPCREMVPILEKIDKDYEGKLLVTVIDVYKNSIDTQKYNIRVIPTQIFLNSQGKVIYRHEGVLYENKIVEKLVEMGIK